MRMLSRCWSKPRCSSQQDTHPARPADAGDRERFATEIFGPFDVRSDHEIICVAAVKRGDNFEIMSRGGSSQNCAAAGAPDMNAAGGHAGDQSRCAADKNRVDVDPILGEKALLLGEPKGRNPRGIRSVTDDIFSRRAGTKGRKDPDK